MTSNHEPVGDRLRRLMDDKCVAAPGAFNALTAREVALAGFEAGYVSGAATSVSAGVPDVGVLSLDHFRALIRQVCDAAHDGSGQKLPIIADADTGFGEAEMVRRTVVEYHRAGAAGLHIEDQVFPKRCGHLDGKALVPIDHMLEKVQWAAKAAEDCGGGFITCARTDARGVDGFDAAVDRAKRYVDAGADMIFPEGLASEEELNRFAESMSARRSGGRKSGSGPYLLANMTEFGKTPILPVTTFDSMGYDLVIFPVTTLRIAMKAVRDALRTIKRKGSVDSILGDMQTRAELYESIGYTPGTPWEFPA